MLAILVALGSKGDIFPYLALGRALKAAGHAVKLITGGESQQDVNSAGLDYVELVDATTYRAIFEAGVRLSDSGARRLNDSDRRVMGQLFDIVPEKLYRTIEEIQRPGETVLAASEVYSFGTGGLVRRKLGTPYASVWHIPGMLRVFGPMLPARMRGFEDSLKNFFLLKLWMLRESKKSYDRFRAHLGLDPERNYIRGQLYEQDLNLALFPKWFVPWFKGQMPNTVFSGFPLYDPEEDRELPPEVAEFLANGEPPVVFSNASWKTNAEGYFRDSLAVCEELGLRGLFLTQAVSEELPPTRSTLTVPYASHKLVFPLAAAVVHHGGIGTMAIALAAGVPQLVVPVGLDQPFNAKEAKRLGVATIVRHRRYRQDVKAGLEKALHSRKMKSKTREIAKQFAGSPNLGPAVTALERLLGQSGDGRSSR